MRAFLRPRQWAKSKRSHARVELYSELGRWYAVASGQRVSELTQVRGGALVGTGATAGEALEAATTLIRTLEEVDGPNTTAGVW